MHFRDVAHKFIAMLAIGLVMGQSFANICATCNALPNARLCASGLAVPTEQRLAAAANHCEFQAVCSVAGLSLVPADDVRIDARRAAVPPRELVRHSDSRTIKPLLHPPNPAV